jgi:1,4-alpha-glucan branching enzyme
MSNLLERAVTGIASIDREPSALDHDLAMLPSKLSAANSSSIPIPFNNGLVKTVFHFHAPHAKKVLLAGEFTGWRAAPLKMIKGGGGVWYIITRLEPGRHAYGFLVDGEWRNDPGQPDCMVNDFGTFNSVVQISRPFPGLPACNLSRKDR